MNKITSIINNKIITKAEKLCKQRKVRMTQQRLEVLRLLSKQNIAASAYDLLDLLRKSEPHAKPSTIYRALNFLLQQRFIHRIESTNSFILCHYFTDPLHTFAFFICDKCGLITEYKTDNIKIILQHIASIIEFSILQTVIEVHGVCLQCA